jgi:hypothetical protein
LQQTVGNRGVVALMRQPKTSQPKRPKGAKRPAGILVTVVPDHPMDGEALALLVLEQLYGDDPAAAAVRLQDWESRGIHRVGKRFKIGIAAADVGKPVQVVVNPPHVERDPAEAQQNAEDLAEMDTSGRRSINDETDKRYWAKLRDSSRQKIGLGPDDRDARELWMQTRDEVLKERDQVLRLDSNLQDEIMPYHELAPEDYKTAIQLGQETKDFSAADWARYERTAVGSTDDLGEFELHVRQFAAKRAKEQDLLNRLKGTEGFFKAWRDPWAGEGLKRQRLGHPPPGFKDFDDYDSACDAYLQLFQDRAVEITRVALGASKRLISSELRRYSDETEVLAFHAELGPLRALYDDADHRSKVGDVISEKDGPKRGGPSADPWTKVENERAAHTGAHPILTDPSLKTDDLIVHNARTLGESLRSDARDRLHDVDRTFDALDDDETNVWQFDRMLELAMTELGATKDTIGELIISRHLHTVAVKKIVKAIGMAVLAIGVGLLTFGTGTVAVLAAGGLLALGSYQAAEEVKAYGQANAASHTAFDKNQTVSSTSPSAFWAAFALISLGFDAAALTSALRAAGASLAELERTSDLAKFEEALKAANLPEEVKAALLQTFKTRPKLDKAVAGLRRALGAGKRFGPKGAKAASHAGYIAAQMGMKEFDQFAAYAKTGMLHGVDLGELSAEDVSALRTAFGEGVAKAEQEGVALKRIVGDPAPSGASDPGGDAGGSAPPDTGTAKSSEPGAPAKDHPTTDPGGARRPPATEPPLRVPGLPFASAAEVHAAVQAGLGGLSRSRPSEWQKVAEALALGRGTNQRIADVLPVVMDGLCDPGLYAEVMAEAWTRAARDSTDIETALRQMAAETGLPTQVIPQSSGFLNPAEFFRRYASAEAYFIDLPLANGYHGSLTHLVQDLVVDRALSRAGESMRSPQFRGLFAGTEGTVTRAEFETSEATTFLNADLPAIPVDETEMPVGEYVWRFTYDLILDGHMPQPENIWPILKDILFP